MVRNMLDCGIDEAGRGPLLGPMVICGVLADEKQVDELKKLGVKDSKLLAPKQREFLFDKIKKVISGYELAIISPQEIDEAVESETMNLNWLEAVKSAEIINKLKPQKAIIDSPSNNTEKYKQYVLKLLDGKETKIVAEHKADLNYPIVSAASILAKVTRDREIETLKRKYGELGSGYPSDPVTREFLLKNYRKFPEIFRKSWQSYKEVAGHKGQKKLGEFN